MDINDIAAQAAAKIDAARDQKVNAVRAVAAIGVQLSEAAKMLAETEQKYAKAYAAALRAEWTESDLRGFGLDAPTKKAGGRPHNSKTRRPATAQPATVSAEDGA